MTNTDIFDTIDTTNPVLTVAPIKEETEMLGATTNKITALYCRLSQEDERLGESLSIKISCFNMPVTTGCRIPPFSWMTDTVV